MASLDVAPEITPFIPREINSVADTGLSMNFLSDLVMKVVYFRGTISGSEVANHIGLPFGNVTERVLENLRRQSLMTVQGGASLPSSYEYMVTSKGHAKALELVERSTYASVAPVPIPMYWESVQGQSIRGVVVTREKLMRAFPHLVLPPRLYSQLGPAINSARSVFLFGPSGNGKTSIAETAAHLLGGSIYIPQCIEYDSQIVQLYDPVQHHQIDRPERTSEATMDRRWMLCDRPVVSAGGELTMATLDLVWSETSRYYEAPVQLKANGGVLLIDDFGRQQVAPHDLLNRWIVPLEKREDYLNLRTGQRLRVPFDVLIMFATSMDPRTLVDDAFLRRIRYKIEVPNPNREEYTQIFETVCREKGISFHLGNLEQVFQYYDTMDIEPRGCHPRDLVDQLIDMANYMGMPPALTPELLDLVCDSYFVQGHMSTPGAERF